MMMVMPRVGGPARVPRPMPHPRKTVGEEFKLCDEDGLPIHEKMLQKGHRIFLFLKIFLLAVRFSLEAHYG